MSALQYVHLYPVRSLLVRRTFRQLAADDGLIRRAQAWFRSLGLTSADIHWNEKDHRFTFHKTGATLTYLYLDNERDKDNFQGPGWDFIGADEATQFREDQYLYFFTRNRKSPGLPVPTRIRIATNPGRIGHEWCKKRFVSPFPEAHYVRALVDDNPGIDANDYRAGLMNVDPITRGQIMSGDWDSYEGGRFQRSWFKRFFLFDDDYGEKRFLLEGGDDRGVKVSDCWTFIVCDPACTEQETSDFTAIGVFAVTPQQDVLLLHMIRERLRIDRIVKRPDLDPKDPKCILDAVMMLKPPFSPPEFVGIENSTASIAIVRQAMQTPGFTVRPLNPEGKGKLVRATPAINRCEASQIFVPDSSEMKVPWLEDFLAECTAFTGDDKIDSHDDQVDVLAYAIQALERQGLISAVELASETPEIEDNEDRFHQPESYGGMFGWTR